MGFYFPISSAIRQRPWRTLLQLLHRRKAPQSNAPYRFLILETLLRLGLVVPLVYSKGSREEERKPSPVSNAISALRGFQLLELPSGGINFFRRLALSSCSHSGLTTISQTAPVMAASAAHSTKSIFKSTSTLHAPPLETGGEKKNS